MPDIVCRTIWLKTSFVGFHYWKDAPESLSYLSHKHRHVFEVYVELFVHHEDRDVEFHSVKQKVDKFLGYHPARQGTHASCEMIAEDIGTYLFNEGYRVAEVSVSEDGECGGKAVYSI